MVIKTIVHFEIPANDTARLSRFYSECFGWTFEKAPMTEMDYWLISTGPRGKRDGGWDGSGISNARLSILPGMTHYNPFSSPAMVSAVKQFLDAPMPEIK